MSEERQDERMVKDAVAVKNDSSQVRVSERGEAKREGEARLWSRSTLTWDAREMAWGEKG